MASGQRNKRSSSQPTYRDRKGTDRRTRTSSTASGKSNVKSRSADRSNTRKSTGARKSATSDRRKSAGNNRSRSTKQSSATPLPAPLVAIVAIVVAVILIVWGVTSCTATKTHKKQWEHDHYWQATVEAAEDYYGVDRSFTTAILTMIQVESDGNVNVDKHHDILQALEGDGKKILLKGVKKQGIKKNTPEASIYAGTYEFSLCIADFKKYMGRDPVPDDLNDVALLAQGYNYGHLGWFKWLKHNGIETWTPEVSKQYQAKINGLGTATHGQKIMDTFPRIAEE